MAQQGSSDIPQQSLSQQQPQGAGGLAGQGGGAAGASELGRKTSTDPSELDPIVPKAASDVPLTGLEPAEGVSFKEQVQGHAKMFAGKVFGNDKEAQEGAARIRGLEPQQQQQQ